MITLDQVIPGHLAVTVFVIHDEDQNDYDGRLEEFAREHAGQSVEPLAVASTISPTVASFTFVTDPE